MEPATSPSPDQDPFLFDYDQLHALAEPEAIRVGLRHFKDNRVTDLDWEGDRLWASVEDEDSEEVMSLELVYDADGNLRTICDCAKDSDRPCPHTLAVLFAYGARSGTSVDLSGAVESAIDERVKRGRSEVRVEHLSGELWYGAWSARSITSATRFPIGYRVHIRSLKRRANHCTCPDFATNQLGTCKHIEAVLHQIQKRRDYAKLKDLPPPSHYVYLDWEAENAPAIRLHRGTEVEVGLSRLLQDRFDASGAFLHRLPDDFLRFAEMVAGRDDIDLGEDALGYVRRLAENAAQQVRAADIGERIRATGGRLPGVNARLYPYQVEGVAFLAANGRALLADDMGLGKTLQAIAAATWLREQAEVERVLVICPASLKHQWAREIQRFTGQEVEVVQGSAAARAVQYRRGNGVFVINYELVLRDVSVINEVLRPDLLILDEAQRIKNWRTKIATAVKRIPSRYAFVLSGTPLENRLEDLYSLMQVVDQKVLGPLWRYLVDFHITDERGKVLGYRNLSELPERIEQRLDVALTPKQLELHDDAVSAAGRLAHIAKRRPLTPVEQNRLLASLQKARMACNAAGLVDKETEGSPKLDELENILDELCRMSGLKAVVFSQWEQMTQMVEQRLRRMGLGCVRLHGGVPTARRGGLMDRFRDDDAIQVFISTDAGGVGLNLQCASVLVNLDIPWNPAVLDQRIARVHRLGQTAKVQILVLVAADSYEERVLALVQGKRNLFDNVVDPEGSEDVVGVSKKLVEVLTEDLAEEGAADTPLAGDVQAESVEGPESEPPPVGPSPSALEERGTDSALEAEVRRSVLAVQNTFGPRIERILGSGGGLLVVIDRVDEEADLTADRISERVPVALIDPRTLGGLQRLGGASPVAGARTLFEAPPEPAHPREPLLLRQARDKLKGAEVLIEQACPVPATELLLGALLCAAALRAQLDTPPTPREAGVWLYKDALPKGALSAEQAGLVMRAMALAQGAEAVPEAMLRELIVDVWAFVEQTFPE